MMKNESGSMAVDTMARENKMAIAFTTDLRTISQLIPYLEARRELAKKYMNGVGKDDLQKKNMFEMLECYNDDIKKILGL